MNPNVQSFREQLHKEKLVTTPSGFTFKLRRLAVMDYLKAGLSDMPNEFYSFAISLQTGVDIGLSEEDKKKNFKLFEEYLRVTVEQGIIDPPVILMWDKAKEETHLLWGEIPQQDQNYLIGCISGRIEIKDESNVAIETGAGKPV